MAEENAAKRQTTEPSQGTLSDLNALLSPSRAFVARLFPTPLSPSCAARLSRLRWLGSARPRAPTGLMKIPELSHGVMDQFSALPEKPRFTMLQLVL